MMSDPPLCYCPVRSSVVITTVTTHGTQLVLCERLMVASELVAVYLKSNWCRKCIFIWNQLRRCIWHLLYQHNVAVWRSAVTCLFVSICLAISSLSQNKIQIFDISQIFSSLAFSMLHRPSWLCQAWLKLHFNIKIHPDKHFSIQSDLISIHINTLEKRKQIIFYS